MNSFCSYVVKVKGTILLLVLLFSVLFTRIYAEETTFVSFDSTCYLAVSENIKSGKGAYFHLPTADKSSEERYFAIWPLGYPLLLVALSWAFSTNLLVASKLLNFIAILLIAYLMYRIRPSHLFYFVLLFGSFSALEVFSYTWSEGIFMASLLFYLYVLSKHIQKADFKSLSLLFFLFLLTLSLRYVGAFLWIVNAVVLLMFRFEKRRFMVMNVVVFALFGMYLYHNYQMTGYLTGIERVNPAMVSFKEFFRSFFVALLNVGLVIRKFTHFSDIPFYLTTAFQLVVFFFLLKKMTQGLLLQNDLLTKLLVLGLLVYLGSLFLLTLMGAVSYFDYRTMFPVEFLAWVIGMYQLTADENAELLKKSKPYLMGLFLCSLLFNLPKRFIANSFCSFSQHICIQPQNYQSNVTH